MSRWFKDSAMGPSDALASSLRQPFRLDEMSLINESLTEIDGPQAFVSQKLHTVASGSSGIRLQRTVPESEFRARTGLSRRKTTPSILKQPGYLFWIRDASENEIVLV